MSECIFYYAAAVLPSTPLASRPSLEALLISGCHHGESSRSSLDECSLSARWYIHISTSRFYAASPPAAIAPSALASFTTFASSALSVSYIYSVTADAVATTSPLNPARGPGERCISSPSAEIEFGAF